MRLKNPCCYSFDDLIKASKENNRSRVVFRSSDISKMTQSEINLLVKELCEISGWFWNDVKVGDTIYTSFSPEIDSI